MHLKKAIQSVAISERSYSGLHTVSTRVSLSGFGQVPKVGTGIGLSPTLISRIALFSSVFKGKHTRSIRHPRGQSLAKSNRPCARVCVFARVHADKIETDYTLSLNSLLVFDLTGKPLEADPQDFK